MAGAIALTTRYWRVGAIALFFGVYSLQFGNRLVVNGGDGLFRIYCAITAAFGILGSSTLVNAPVGCVLIERWGLLLVRLQLTVLYVASVLYKVAEEPWQRGYGFILAVSWQEYERLPLPEFLMDPLLGNVVTVVTLAAEAIIPIALWSARWRRWGMALGVALHGGILYAMDVGLFSFVVVGGYVAFLTADESGRVCAFVRESLKRGGEWIAHRKRNWVVTKRA
jgi:hypothetical protein